MHISSSTTRPLDWAHLSLSSKLATLTSISLEKVLRQMASILVETINEICDSQSGLSLKLCLKMPPPPKHDNFPTSMLLWLQVIAERQEMLQGKLTGWSTEGEIKREKVCVCVHVCVCAH